MKFFSLSVAFLIVVSQEITLTRAASVLPEKNFNATFTHSMTEQHFGIHAFFYLWYQTPAIDGTWQHWNHRILPHWDEKQVLFSSGVEVKN